MKLPTILATAALTIISSLSLAQDRTTASPGTKAQGTTNSSLASCRNLPKAGEWENITPAGRSTRPAVNGTVAASIIVDPFQPNRVWLGTSMENREIWRSDDCGANWVRVNTGRGSVGNGRDIGGVGDGSQWSMQVDPVIPDTIYAVSGYGAQSLWKSEDGGVNWRDVFVGTEYDRVAEYRFVNNVTIDPTNNLHVAVSTHGSCKPPYQPSCIAESFDGGKTWKIVVAPEGWVEGGGLIIVKGPLWIWCGSKMLITKDGGGTWSETLAGGGNCEAEYTMKPFVPASNGKYYLGSRYGVIRSSDGVNWEHIPSARQRLVMVTHAGDRIFASDQWSSTIRWARVGSDNVWLDLPAPPQVKLGSNDSEGIPFMAYDDVHRILYASMFSGGVARLHLP